MGAAVGERARPADPGGHPRPGPDHRRPRACSRRGPDRLDVPLRLEPVDPPVLRADLLADPVLSRLEVVRMPAGSNPSYLSREELARLRELLPMPGGSLSSLVMVAVPLPSPMVPPVTADSPTENISSGSTTVSPLTVTVTVLLVRQLQVDYRTGRFTSPLRRGRDRPPLLRSLRPRPSARRLRGSSPAQPYLASP